MTLPVRPTHEDDDALNLLLAKDRLSDWAASFVESLANWDGPWTARQAEQFDEVWVEYVAHAIEHPDGERR